MSTVAPLSPPPLRDGDRLTSDEFMRRWEAMPELIDGIVYMASPVTTPATGYLDRRLCGRDKGLATREHAACAARQTPG
jgi:hypothetical protein